MYTSPCSQTMFSMVYFQKWNCQLVHTIYRLLPLSAIAKLASRVTPMCIIDHALEMPFPYIITNTRYYQSFKVLLVRQGAKCVFICIFLITDGTKYFSYFFFAIQVLSSIHCLTMSLLFFPLYYLYFLVDLHKFFLIFLIDYPFGLHEWQRSFRVCGFSFHIIYGVFKCVGLLHFNVYNLSFVFFIVIKDTQHKIYHQ